ncbi:uroporphyrinogen-III synthase [Paracrocinitomix mangrovi]|uniref:uroporphyrinogen-III synthase n=1 Tax=Paracrocinitomix mangrovi TaxID=2862509 RepID=UPI001C8D090B|nr:uroporphyrinogen-III synthase [Paracrocinitomix mangrovi]UKN00791.1 uroporphyrinogen-III synthase [Paracrocinitomix mangrovi]
MGFPKKILVSRNLSTDSVLREWATEHNHALIEAPFIRIDAVTNIDIPQSDWIFFSSPNGVDIYFDHHPILAKKIAAYGGGTMNRLTSRGIEADFVGDNRKTPEKIGEDFFNFIDPNEVVLFPVSQLSRKSIIQVNQKNKCIELVIYNTSTEATEMPKVDYAILTSPSNIDGYIKANPIENVRFIVLGTTSKNHFDNLNLGAEVYMPKSSTEEAVIELLEDLMRQA